MNRCDTASSLVRFGVRDYDPYTGRWTARDPILFDGGDANLYAYSANDSVNFWDPSGLAIKALGPCEEFGFWDHLSFVLDLIPSPLAVVGLAGKAINLPAWRKVTVNMTHIAERHLAGGPFTAGRSVFPSTMNQTGIMRAIREAYESAAKAGVQGS